MNEEQKMKFQFARDMLTNEQLAEPDFVMRLVNRSTDAHRFTYKGQTYYTFTFDDGICDEQSALRITT